MVARVSTASLVKHLKSDPRVVRMRETFTTAPIFNLNIEQLSDEIASSHKIREIRVLNSQEPKYLDKLLRANTTDQATRSRFTEIMVECSRASSKLEKMIEYLSNYLLTAYSSELRVFRTKEERSYIINAVLKQFRDYLIDVNSLKESAMLVVADIDKGQWSLKLSVEIMKIHMDKERFI